MIHVRGKERETSLHCPRRGDGCVRVRCTREKDEGWYVMSRGGIIRGSVLRGKSFDDCFARRRVVRCAGTRLRAINSRDIFETRYETLRSELNTHDLLHLDPVVQCFSQGEDQHELATKYVVRARSARINHSFHVSITILKFNYHLYSRKHLKKSE